MTKEQEHIHEFVEIKRDVITGRKGSIEICLCGFVKPKTSSRIDRLMKQNELDERRRKWQAKRFAKIK